MIYKTFKKKLLSFCVYISTTIKMTNAQSKTLWNDLEVEKNFVINELIENGFGDDIDGRSIEELVNDDNPFSNWFLSAYGETHYIRMCDGIGEIDWNNLMFRLGLCKVDMGGTCMYENSYLFNARKKQNYKNLNIVETDGDDYFHYFIKYEEDGEIMMEDCSNGRYTKMRYDDYKKYGLYKKNTSWITKKGCRMNDNKAEKNFRHMYMKTLEDKYNVMMYKDMGITRPKILAQRLLNL